MTIPNSIGMKRRPKHNLMVHKNPEGKQIFLNYLYVLWFLLLLLGTACTLNKSENHAQDDPNAILGESQWVLSALTYRDEQMEIDALYPTYFRFDIENGFLLVTIPCEGTDTLTRGFGPSITFQDNQQYTLIPNEMETPDCGDLIEEQNENLRVLETSQYEMQDEKLVLIGRNIQIVLERETSNR